MGDVNNIELYSITLSHYIYMALNAVYEAVFTGVFLFRTLLVSAKSRYSEILLYHERLLGLMAHLLLEEWKKTTENKEELEEKTRKPIMSTRSFQPISKNF